MKNWLAARPYFAASLFEGALIPVALLLAWAFGLSLWEQMAFTSDVIGETILGTVPMLLLFVLMARQRGHWALELSTKVRYFVRQLFVGAPAGAVLLVCVLAGVGEEMLFRGVLQDGLERSFGPLAGLILASIVFGLAHYLSFAYFVVATLIGLYLGWLYQATGNLLVPIGVHALYDWVVIHYYLRSARVAGT